MYRLMRDKGPGTPVEQSPDNPFASLMEAVDCLIVEREYITECHGLYPADLVDGKYIFTKITSTQEVIPPGTVIDGKFVGEGYITHRHTDLICRLWLEELAE